MKTILFASSILFAIACSTTSDGTTGPGGDDCLSDSCVCSGDSSCFHACEPGGPPCHVQCYAGQPCDVACESSEECHVEAAAAANVMVDCSGTAECHVTCPASGCTVTNCIGADCVVSCGVLGVATHNGSTATCP